MNEAMKAEHQGYGSYEYKCKDENCFFCERMGLRIVPKPETDVTPRINLYGKRIWQQHELDLLLSDLTTLHEIPGRSIGAVRTKRLQLAKEANMGSPYLNNHCNRKHPMQPYKIKQKVKHQFRVNFLNKNITTKENY